MKVPAERLRSTLGITNVQYVVKKHSLAVVDSPLADPLTAASSTGSLPSIRGVHADLRRA
jgi:hypothetical protein